MSVKPSPPPDLRVPRSIAVIMDGNGRWAAQRGLPRIKGHEHGASAVRETVEESVRLGVEALTLYAFSEENWRRPQLEIDLLMKLLKRFLVEERAGLMENNIRLGHIGRRERLPADVLDCLDQSIAVTRGNTGMQLDLAISYGGRAEIVDAARALAVRVANGELDPSAITEEVFAQHLYRPGVPDPDLLIRTAGEQRISNFLLWQISYAEIYVADVCWPDFRRPHLWEALREYGRRVRKFGGVV
jgi:undecaprenyl diphosphate synthase